MANGDGPFYVIAGLGFSAVLNHRLLRATSFGKQRLGDLPLLHIGLPDPWSTYETGGMGQWPGLLTMPQFSECNVGANPKEFLSPKAFASVTRMEMERLESQHPGVSTRWGLIEEIKKHDKEFEVRFTDPQGRECSVRARMIDVCTGPGGALKLEPELIEPKELADEYLDRSPMLGTRRLMTGEEFLTSQTSIPFASAICVVGNGGTAAWCVERALESRNTESVLWVMRSLSDSAFPPSKRNDRLLKEVKRLGWELSPELSPVPFESRLRLAVGYEVGRLDLKDNRVAADFKAHAGTPSKAYRDHLGTDCGRLTSQFFDQIVVAIGVRKVVPDCLPKMTLHPIFRQMGKVNRRARTNTVVGFADNTAPEHSRIRILGSAARSLPPDYYPSALEKLERYEETLAKQAHGSQIPTGVLSIAWANGFFSADERNSNANTADRRDLEAQGVENGLVEQFLLQRKKKVEPFTELPPELQGKGLDLTY